MRLAQSFKLQKVIGPADFTRAAGKEKCETPILEYVCEDCTHQFETIVMGSRVPACPSCESKRLERRLSVFAVGGQSNGFAASEPFGACGTCGDPRGPGACSMN